jgi:hypothetical protein
MSSLDSVLAEKETDAEHMMRAAAKKHPTIVLRPCLCRTVAIRWFFLDNHWLVLTIRDSTNRKSAVFPDLRDLACFPVSRKPQSDHGRPAIV